MATSTIARQIGSVMANATRNGASGGGWYTPLMAAASRAIAERLPLVDLVLEIRDARIPSSSEYEQLRRTCKSSSKRIIVLNKMDLADRSQTKEWMGYFEKNNCIAYGVDAHNKEGIKQFLNFLQAQVRELRKNNHSYTTTILLVGIPNVGKSALANSLHQIGRISAAEKGKLKHTTVSPDPGETKDISSLKIGSHPNIYVLDTPGVLPPKISDVEVRSKLALTGAINDYLVGEELAQYFLTILNLSEEYKKWSKLSQNEIVKPLADHKAEHSSGVKVDVKRGRQYPTDHTQDFVVNDVRKTLFEMISYFDGNMNDESDLTRLIEAEIVALKEAFRIPATLNEEDARYKVAAKLLNLYRTGRLGRYTIDYIP